MNVVILLPEGKVVASAITGSYKLFKKAIELSGGTDRIDFVGQGAFALDGLLYFHPDQGFDQAPFGDLIIVPPIKEDIIDAISSNDEMKRWIAERYAGGAHLACLCTGSFFLAEMGLLDGVQCSTHWAFSDQFARRFPAADLRDQSIITEDERIFTSGGAFSFLNLIVYMIERFYGKEIAKIVAGIYQVDHPRRSQTPFVVFNDQKKHCDAGIAKVQEYLEKHYSRKITNAQLAKIARLGERTFIRRFRSCTGNTPNQYLQRVRIEAAKALLTDSDDPVLDIQLQVGYLDYKTFNVIFTRYAGLPPSAYRSAYGRRSLLEVG